MPTIFEEDTNEYNIEFKCQADIGQNIAFRPLTLVLEEGIGYSSPILKLDIIDVTASLIGENKLPPNTVFELNLGKNSQSMEKYEFELSKVHSEPTEPLSPLNTGLEMHFLMTDWIELINKKRNRSWKGKEYSDVVEEIVGEANLEPDVEKTKPFENLGKEWDENIIYQIFWTNLQLLKWITKRARSDQHNCCGFEFGIKPSKEFFFKTPNELFQNSPVKEFEYAPYLINEGGEVAGNMIINFEVIDDYVSFMKDGASGFKYRWFDYDTKELKDDEIDITDTEAGQLAENYYIAEDHLDYKNYLYGFDDTKIEDIAESKLVSLANSIQNIRIVIKGDNTIHIGDIIKVYVMSGKENQANETLSGKYLVSKAKHKLTFNEKNKSFVTELLLTRSGPDSDVEGLTESSTGKIG